MKVLQLMQDDYLPSICGNAFVADHFKSMMDREGIENYIWLDNKPRPVYAKLSNGAIVFNTRGKEEDAKNDITAIVSANDIDVILVHDPKFSKVQDYLKSTDRKVVLVSHYFCEDVLEGTQSMYDKIIVFQKDQIERYKAGGRVDPSKLFYMPQPMDTDIFHPYPQVAVKERSLVYSGRVIKEKGCHLIIPYLKDLNATYTMIGPLPNKNYLDEMMEQVSKFGLEGKVAYLPPEYDEGVARVLCSNRIFILPSSCDCYSLSMSEALCCGLTCTALDLKDAFNWARDLAFLASNMDEMAAFIKLTFERNSFVSHADYMKSTTSLQALSGPFASMLHQLGGLPQRKVDVKAVDKIETEISKRFQWKGL